MPVPADFSVPAPPPRGTRLTAKEAAKNAQLKELVARGFEAQEAAQYALPLKRPP